MKAIKPNIMKVAQFLYQDNCQVEIQSNIKMQKYPTRENKIYSSGAH